MTQQKKDIMFYSICIGLCFIIIFFKTNIIYMATIPTGSMESTIPIDSKILGDRLYYNQHTPERGDVIIFKYPIDNKTPYIKRIIGLPGETIQIKNSVVYINDQILDEPYLKESWIIDNDDFFFIVPQNHYFVLGDNRNNSLDARYWSQIANLNNLNNPEQYTFISRSNILAKAKYIYYPHFKKIK